MTFSILPLDALVWRERSDNRWVASLGGVLLWVQYHEGDPAFDEEPYYSWWIGASPRADFLGPIIRNRPALDGIVGDDEDAARKAAYDAGSSFLTGILMDLTGGAA